MFSSSRFTMISALYSFMLCFWFSPIPFAAAQSSEEEMYEDEMYEDEMYEDEMYEDEMYGSSRRSGGSADVYTAPVLAIFNNMDLKPLLASDSKFDVRMGPALEAEAKEVFSAGNHALACHLIYGHMGAEYDEAGPSLDRVQLSQLLKRPVWNLRWAVSMAVRGGEDVDDPSPIAMGTSGGYESEDMDMDMGMDFRRPQRRPQRPSQRRDRDEFMDDEDQFMDEEYMDEEQDVEEQAEVPSMLSTDAAEQLEKYLGGVAAISAAEFDKRFKSGNFGTIFPMETGPADSLDPRQDANRGAVRGSVDSDNAVALSQPAADLIRNASPALPMWRPGLVFLGIGSSSEIIATAKAEQIDVLLHFDVVLKQQGRQDQTWVQNVSRARLIHVAEGKSLIVSKAMDSLEVHQLQSSGRLSDTGRYIDEQMAGLWRTVDREFKLTEMPKLSPESARRRIGTLLASGGGRNLRTLAEIRLYQSQGLIENAEAENAYDIIGGSDALMMMHGPRDERLEMARTWAIEAVTSEE